MHVVCCCSIWLSSVSGRFPRSHISDPYFNLLLFISPPWASSFAFLSSQSPCRNLKVTIFRGTSSSNRSVVLRRSGAHQPWASRNNSKCGKMESYVNEKFVGGVRSKNSPEEALQRWRDLVGVVKNPKRRFRFTANLSKRSEAAAMKRSNHVRLFLPFVPSKSSRCTHFSDSLGSSQIVMRWKSLKWAALARL